MNLEKFLKGKKEDTKFRGYVSLNESNEARITLLFDDGDYIDIDVKENECILSKSNYPLFQF